MGMRVKGLIKAMNGCDRLVKEMPRAAGDGVDDSVDNLMKKSQRQVPKETGALAETAHIVNHITGGYKRSKGVRYGQPGEGEGIIDYAAAVHEILKASHKSPTKAKYVEDPLVQGVPYDKRAVKKAVKSAVRRSFR